MLLLEVPSKRFLEALQVFGNLLVELGAAVVVILWNELEVSDRLGVFLAEWTDAGRKDNEPVVAFTNFVVQKFTRMLLLVVEAHAAVLVGLVTSSIIRHFSILRIAILFVYLSLLEFPLYKFHVKAGILYFIFPCLWVVHSDPHQQVSLLK